MKSRIPRPFSLHWGSGQIAEEAIGMSPHHQPRIQLLKFEDGSRALRFCSYNLRGQFQRMPLIVGEETVSTLQQSIETCPGIRGLLQQLLSEG